MNNRVTANDLKTKGVSLLEPIIRKGLEVVITVHGESKYIVLSVDEYSRLRDLELEDALAEAQSDLDSGRYHEDSVEEHIKRITHA